MFDWKEKTTLHKLLMCIMLFPTESYSEELPLSTFLPDDYKCALPDVTTDDDNLDLTRFRYDFSKISEVKFPGLIGPLNERLFCKIKCIDGNWVGPLCATSPDGRFQPILRECLFHNDHPLLAISFKNSSIEKETNFPHGSAIVTRCKHFGHYKLKGENVIICENGDWSPKWPECVPTTVITNFTGDAPPTIQYTVVSGSAVVMPSGELYVYPESNLRLDCITPRALGDPDWSWTQASGQHNSVWSEEESEKNSHYRLTLIKMSARHSDQYTCTTPGGHTNTILIKVVSVICPAILVTSQHIRQFAQGTRLGHSVHFSCAPGFHLNGSSIVTCMGDGYWSASPPVCSEIFCPPLQPPPHISVVDYNTSYGGRAVFQCAWGYRLVGPPGIECEQDGQWSQNMPSCMPIYCPNPLVPVNGRLLTVSTKDGKYPVGDLIIYACDDSFQMDGESSIVCTENGFWSHPPPFCVSISQIRKADTIYIENTTLIYFEDQNR